MSSVAEEENLKQEGAIHPSPKGLGFLASTDKTPFNVKKAALFYLWKQKKSNDFSGGKNYAAFCKLALKI